MKKSYAKQLKTGPVFQVIDRFTFGNLIKLIGKGKGIGEDWKFIGLFKERKYALALMKALTMKARSK